MGTEKPTDFTRRGSVAVIAVTKRGVAIARELCLSENWDIYIPQSHAKERTLGERAIRGAFTGFVQSIFHLYDGIVFISAAGIAVRAIAEVIIDKRQDPAVVVVDDGGKYSISLLSGHLGGANRLAHHVGGILGALPVVTTASDALGFDGIDVLAGDLGFYIDNFSDLKHVSSSIVNGERVAFIASTDCDSQDIVMKLNPPNIEITGEVTGGTRAAIFATDREVEDPGVPYIVLRPQNTVIGIGARRGVSFGRLKSILMQELQGLKLSLHSIDKIATIDIKRDEECILELGEYLDVPISLYCADELRRVEGLFPRSEFVKGIVGVGSVARPVGFLASEKGHELGHYKGCGITLAIYKRRTL